MRRIEDMQPIELPPCGHCGKPHDRKSLCDRFDCPELRNPPALLSSGEFIVEAKATNETGHTFLKAINNAVDGVALGRIVSSIKHHGPKK